MKTLTHQSLILSSALFFLCNGYSQNAEVPTYRVPRTIEEIRRIDSAKAQVAHRVHEKRREIEQWKELLATVVEAKQAMIKEIARREAQKRNLEARFQTMKGEARISNVYPEWGFVIFDAGKMDDVVQHQTFSVRREGRLVGQLLVTDSEASQSVADILRRSGSAGQRIRVGDVVSAR